MKAVYALIFFLAIGYVFADENSASSESVEEGEQGRLWWPWPWRPKCPAGRVWREVQCVRTCATLNQPCRPGPWESRCVCWKFLVENSEGKCVLPWSKKCKNESWTTSTEPPTTTTETTTNETTTTETTTVSEDTTTEQPTDVTV